MFNTQVWVHHLACMVTVPNFEFCYQTIIQSGEPSPWIRSSWILTIISDKFCECGKQQDPAQITYTDVLWRPVFTEWSTLTNELTDNNRWKYNRRHLPWLWPTEYSNIHYFKKAIKSTFAFHLFMLYLVMLSIALTIQC